MERFQTHKKIITGSLNFMIVVAIGVAFLLYQPTSSSNNPSKLFDRTLKAVADAHRTPAPSSSPSASPSAAATPEPEVAQAGAQADAQANSPVVAGERSDTGRVAPPQAPRSQAGSGGTGAASVIPQAPPAPTGGLAATVTKAVQPLVPTANQAVSPLLQGATSLIGR